MRYENIQSAAIDLLRFPLAVMIVIHHACPAVVPVSDTPFPLLSVPGLLNIFYILCSNVIGLVAVPAFFFISGFLFFRTIPDFNFRSWLDKMKRRVNTLVLPYILWNLLPFAFCLLYGALGYLRSGLPDSIPDDLRDANLYSVFWEWGKWGGNMKNIFGAAIYNTGPYDMPLWFVRDLLIVMLLSPAIYVIVRYLRLWGLGLLFFCMYTHLWTHPIWLSPYAAFYFATGAWFAVRHQSFVAFAIRMRHLLYIVAVPLLVGCVYFNCATTPAGLWIFPLFQLVGVFIMFIIATRIVRRGCRPFKVLAPASFFIYAYHSVRLIPYRGSVLAIISKSLESLFSQGTEAVFITYNLSVIFVVGIGLALYTLLQRYLPRVARILNGR